MISGVKRKGEKGEICPECGGSIISSYERGESVCDQCGLIIEENVVDFTHSGKRAFTSQEKSKRERTGPPITNLLPDMGLTTVINRKDIENPDLKRAAKWNTRLSWQKRNLLIATTELKRICSNLDLPDHIKGEAITLYKKAFKLNLIRGRSINGMVAASIYYALRREGIPRTLQEVLNETSAKDREVKKCYYLLIRELKLKTPSINPLAFLPRYISELGFDSDIGQTAINLLSKFMAKFSISGYDPKGLCAGVLYLASKLKGNSITQKDIAETIGITEVTLRSRYKELAKKLEIPL